MPENPHLTLKIDGKKADGDSRELEDGSIECSSVAFGVSCPHDWSTGSSAGKRQWSEISITKRPDKLSPLLHKALTNNTVVDGTLKFWRSPKDGGSVHENYYTVEFGTGRVASISFGGSGGGADSTVESVSFVFRTISIKYDSKDAKGILFTDDHSEKKK
jgi:type VI secretion system secreted protein Hcp